MLRFDRDALLCDLAETYHILNYREIPALTLATLAAGLRDDSRIRMAQSGMRANFDTILLAAAVDRLSILLWMQTEDGQNGLNRPASILDQLINDPKDSEIIGFDTGDDFMSAWAEITGR